MMLTRFLVRMRGVRTPPPTMLEPVTYIPLQTQKQEVPNLLQVLKWLSRIHILLYVKTDVVIAHHAAPTTEREIASPMPILPHIQGDVSSRYLSQNNAANDLLSSCNSSYHSRTHNIKILCKKLQYTRVRAVWDIWLTVMNLLSWH